MTYYCVFTNVETISEVLRAHKSTQCKVNKIEPQEEIVKISLRNSLNANIFYSENTRAELKQRIFECKIQSEENKNK